MPSLVNIPKRQYGTLKNLSALKDEQIADLEKGLSEVSPSISVSSFAKRLSEKVRSIPEDDVFDYVAMLCGLYPAKENYGKNAEQIASDVRTTLESETPQTFPKEALPFVESRVKRLLGIDKGIAITAKAFDVATEHNNVCCTSRIVSDIRPVFSADASEIAGGIITHNLSIRYHNNGELKAFFVAMTAEDLDELKDVIARAEKKASQMSASLSKAGITDLGTD